MLSNTLFPKARSISAFNYTWYDKFSSTGILLTISSSLNLPWMYKKETKCLTVFTGEANAYKIIVLYFF